MAHYIPKLGRYDSGHLLTIANHVQQLDYANIRLGISSWWGPDQKSDRARLLLMMDISLRITEGRLKWCVYFEPQKGDDSVEGIRKKLQYLKHWFVDHPSYARISSADGNNINNNNNKPVIFVYNLKSNCETSKRWMIAANNEWHVVLKLFSGWKDCQYQPSSWHQYGPSTPFQYQKEQFQVLYFQFS